MSTGPEPEERERILRAADVLYANAAPLLRSEAYDLAAHMLAETESQVSALKADVARLEGERDAARRLADEGCDLLARGQEIIAALTAEQDGTAFVGTAEEAAAASTTPTGDQT